MTWTKKHQQFALSCRLRPSTINLMMFIMRRAKPFLAQNLEIDLRLFNNWVKRHRGKGYDRKTLKAALAQLDESSKGLILIEKTYTWAIHRLLIRPLSFVLSQNSPKTAKTPQTPTLNPMFGAEHKKAVDRQQQHNISRLNTLFQKVGIKYDQHALLRIWRLAGKSMDSVSEAIEMLLHRHSTQAKAIPNPQGWLIDCLKYGWYKDFDLYYQAELPFFKSGEAIANFVRGVTAIDYGNT
ncbi:MAG: hypothetical protein AAFQ14_09810 [Cyanobacteria bacterium J06621_12]